MKATNHIEQQQNKFRFIGSNYCLFKHFLHLTCQSLLRAIVRVIFQDNQIKIYLTSTACVMLFNLEDSKRCEENVIERLQGNSLKNQECWLDKMQGTEIIIWRTWSAFHLKHVYALRIFVLQPNKKIPGVYRLSRFSSAPITARTGNAKLPEFCFL